MGDDDDLNIVEVICKAQNIQKGQMDATITILHGTIATKERRLYLFSKEQIRSSSRYHHHRLANQSLLRRSPTLSAVERHVTQNSSSTKFRQVGLHWPIRRCVRQVKVLLNNPHKLRMLLSRPWGISKSSKTLLSWSCKHSKYHWIHKRLLGSLSSSSLKLGHLLFEADCFGQFFRPRSPKTRHLVLGTADRQTLSWRRDVSKAALLDAWEFYLVKWSVWLDQVSLLHELGVADKMSERKEASPTVGAKLPLQGWFRWQAKRPISFKCASATCSRSIEWQAVVGRMPVRLHFSTSRSCTSPHKHR